MGIILLRFIISFPNGAFREINPIVSSRKMVRGNQEQSFQDVRYRSIRKDRLRRKISICQLELQEIQPEDMPQSFPPANVATVLLQGSSYLPIHLGQSELFHWEQDTRTWHHGITAQISGGYQIVTPGEYPGCLRTKYPIVSCEGFSWCEYELQNRTSADLFQTPK